MLHVDESYDRVDNIHASVTFVLILLLLNKEGLVFVAVVTVIVVITFVNDLESLRYLVFLRFKLYLVLLEQFLEFTCSCSLGGEFLIVDLHKALVYFLFLCILLNLIKLLADSFVIEAKRIDLKQILYLLNVFLRLLLLELVDIREVVLDEGGRVI